MNISRLPAGKLISLPDFTAVVQEGMDDDGNVRGESNTVAEAKISWQEKRRIVFVSSFIQGQFRRQDPTDVVLITGVIPCERILDGDWKSVSGLGVVQG